MQLRHLRVRNIRSYESAAVDFSPGTTLVSGDVGSGKTSLLYAIEMALFGTSEVDAAYLVRHGGSHAEVAVTFVDAEHRYEVSRRFRRVQRKGRPVFEPEGIWFSVDGAKTEYSATELRQRVIELLGFPDNPSPTAHSDLWRWAVYVPQERMRDILAARPQDRLETVRKALGVERYRTAADNAQDLTSDLRRTASARRAEADLLQHYDEEFASASTEAERLQVERVALDGAIAVAERELRTAREDVETLDAAVRRSEADRREWESLGRESEADRRALDERARLREERARVAAERRSEVERARGEAEDLVGRASALAATEAKVAGLRGELDALSPELKRLQAARAEVGVGERRLAAAHDDRERAAADVGVAETAVARSMEEGPTHEPPAPTPEPLEAIDRRLVALRTDEATALAELTRAQGAVHEWEELLHAGVCPRCGQTVRPDEFEPHRAEASDAAARAEVAYHRSTELRAHAEDDRRSRERFERARERWEQAERSRASARAILEAARARAALAASSLEELRTSIASAVEQRTRTEPAERRETEIRALLAATESERGRLASEVERDRAAAERLRVARAAAEALDAEVGRLDTEASAIRARSEERVRRIEELRGLLARAEEQRTQLLAAEEHRRATEERLEEERRTRVRIDTRLDEAIRRRAGADRGRAERARRIEEAVDLEAKAAWVSGPFRKTVLVMEQRLLEHARVVFDRHFSRYFSALIEDPALVARVDAAFQPSVAIEGAWTPAEALSGGERTSLALAFRLALAQVVRTLGQLRLDTVLLDEPTDGFSPEQVVRMGELLDELDLPQVILVSHEDALAGIADRVVRVVKVDGRSTLRAGAAEASRGPAAGEEAPETPRRTRARRAPPSLG